MPVNCFDPHTLATSLLVLISISFSVGVLVGACFFRLGYRQEKSAQENELELKRAREGYRQMRERHQQLLSTYQQVSLAPLMNDLKKSELRADLEPLSGRHWL